MLTEKDISNIKVTWKTLTFPEIKSRLQELYHSDMPLVDLISALYWDLIETKQKQNQRGTKTITFTDKELEVLSRYLWQNPCSNGCCCKVPKNVDFYE